MYDTIIIGAGPAGITAGIYAKRGNLETLIIHNCESALQKATKIEKGSGKPNKEKVAKITKEQIKAIAEQKMPDLNAASLETAMSMVAGTARSMGVVVVD